MEQKKAVIRNIGNLPLSKVIAEWTQQRLELWMELKRQGWTHDRIAAEYNVSRQAVGQFLKRNKK